MKLVASADRMIKDKTSEIDKKYFISKDEIYLYFDGYDCEIMINNDKFSGNVHTIENTLDELEKELRRKRELMSDRNKKYDYKSFIFTNDIVRAVKSLQLSRDNSEFLFAQAGNHTKGQLFKVISDARPFILVNMQPLACNNVSGFEGDGAQKIKSVLDFNCRVAGQSLHHLGQTIGRNIEKMEGTLIREQRKKDADFYLPRLFSFRNMRFPEWEGQIIRNYNLLQCANMAGLLQFDPAQSFKIHENIISFDIKSAYLSVLINQPIFPGDLTVIDIDPREKYIDYMGHEKKMDPFTSSEQIMEKICRFEKNNKWYYLAIDPNYHGDDERQLKLIYQMQPFRRNFKKHPDTELLFVNQDQMICFLKWDKLFYDEYYSIYMDLSFDELLTKILLYFPDAHVVLMYSKDKSNYLPKQFRDAKMKLYKLKEEQPAGAVERDIIKLYTELTYGKGLQLRSFETDQDVIKLVTNETINIAMSLTCCSFTRWRLVHDWSGFTPLYLDSDSIKFSFGPESNNFAALIQRREDLAVSNTAAAVLAGYPDSNLGEWNIDGIYHYMILLKKKCYIGYKDDGSTEIKLAGCDRKAAADYFKNNTLELLKQIEDEKKLVIPNGRKVKTVVLPNNEYSYSKYQDVIYKGDQN